MGVLFGLLDLGRRAVEGGLELPGSPENVYDHAGEKNTDVRAIAALVLGVMALGLGPFASLPAIICGHLALARIRRMPDVSGTGLAMAGLVLGYGLTVVWVAVLILYRMAPTPHTAS